MRDYDDLSMGLFVRAFIQAQLGMLPNPGLGRKLFIKTNLPYATHPTGRGDYIALNREYKPLGWPVDRPAFIDYGDPVWAPFCFYPASDHVDLGDGFSQFYWPGREPWSSVSALGDYTDRLGFVFGTRVRP